MRTPLLITFCMVSAIGWAQDWALINPAYKYNYSNDGTDTIRHQIKVINTETLGPEISIFQLNRTAELCFNCWENCDLRLGIPQFMQGSCSVAGTDWQFNDPGTLRILATAALNSEWVFDHENATLANLVSIEETMAFGVLDSTRTMVSELGDSVTWSKDHGILLWHLNDGERYELIGVNGPNAGIIIPSFQDFFRYQAGDIVEMASGSGEWDNHPTPVTTYTRFYVQERIEGNGSVSFNGNAHRISRYYNGQFSVPQYGPYTWEMDPASDSVLHPMLSAPDEFVEIGRSTISGSPMLQLVAKHHLGAEGEYVIEGTPGGYSGLIFSGAEPALDTCASISSCPSWGVGTLYYLDTKLGLRGVHRCVGNRYSSFGTYAAIISGDTIGTMQSDEFFHVGISEGLTTSKIVLSPNPAGNELLLSRSADQPITWHLCDLMGRVVLAGRMTQDQETVEVSSLAPGPYVFITTDDHVPTSQKVTIAR